MTNPEELKKKKKQVTKLQQDIEKSKTVGIINLESLPAKQLKAVRAKLKGTATFIFAKKNIIKRALEGSKRESAKQLTQYVDEGIPAIIISDLDAFSLYSELRKSRQMVAAKPGQITREARGQRARRCRLAASSHVAYWL